jgi:hypothetical protein
MYMRVKSVRLQNFRSFVDSGSIELSTINIFFGANNSGKSSILRGIHQLQKGVKDEYGDVRVGSHNAQVSIELVDAFGSSDWPGNAPDGLCSYVATLTSNDRRHGSWSGEVKTKSHTYTGDARLQNYEPNHFVIPYLSRRKAMSYQEDIREAHVLSVMSDSSNLGAKLSRLGNPAFPHHAAYADACRAILGFVVTAVPAENGQRPGIYLPNQQTVPIEQMGEGVPNIASLLASLVVSKNKLFLIEEPENDLHPLALRALLDLIIASSADNQFVISTHSNIVIRHLCAAASSALYRVSTPHGILPHESTVELVAATPEARISALRELGYEFSDFDLWDGWLILEESSAERIIRDYLIPWFCPKLSRIRTVAAGGVDRVEVVLDDFQRLMVFTHLQPAYEGRTWVRVDSDPAGIRAVEALRNKWPSWSIDQIKSFNKEQFELYYPQEFSEKITDVLAIADKSALRIAKRGLLKEVMAWLDSDPARGKEALAKSAGTVIADLEMIEGKI